jgi:hypothetical protein
MTHDEIVTEIQARARKRGILTHYCGPGLRCQGDRGAPDLVAVGMFGAAWIEVKTANDRLKPDQTTWMHALKAAGQAHYVVRELQLRDGGLDAMLDNLAHGQSLLFGAA